MNGRKYENHNRRRSASYPERVMQFVINRDPRTCTTLPEPDMKKTMNRTQLFTLTLAALLGACSQPELSPAPAANAVPGLGQGAVATEAGVRVEARTDAWSARPENLETEVTPILVRITNQSSMPLRLRYNEFHLVGPGGQSFAAIPPFSLEGEVTRPINRPAFASTGFSVAPYLGGYYPGITRFGGAFAPDPIYYGTYGTRFRDLELPTDQMLELALAEGVLDPGGEVQGFLYFEEAGELANRVSFRTELVNASTGDQFGTATIPFVVREGE